MSNPSNTLKQATITNHLNQEPKSKQEDQSSNLKKNISRVDIMKNYLLKKAENMYKLNLSDQEAFKWKFGKNKNNRPLSSFRLIKKQSMNQQVVDIQDLRNISFPVLAYTNKELASFAMIILRENQFFQEKINNETFLQKLVTQISLKYNIVSYHNFSHAFSLSLMLFQCFQNHPELHNIYTQQEQYYAILAGFAHDMNHPGTNNAYQVKMKTARAIQSNNQSVLQSFHIREFWRLLENNPEINFLKTIQNADKVKKRITYLILMTDVAQHFKNLEKLKTLRVDLKANSQSIFSKEQNKQFFLGQMFHGCDIGNPCIDFSNYIKWAALLSYEFNEQTVLQKQNKVEVTQMLKYKDLRTFYQGQVGFINYLVNPLWKQIASVCDTLKMFTQNIDENLKTLNNMIQNFTQQEQKDEHAQLKYVSKCSKDK